MEKELSDDFVANLLKREAKQKLDGYTFVGSPASLPRKLEDQMPRTNKRFLHNILRETDNHNLALRREDARRARERNDPGPELNGRRDRRKFEAESRSAKRPRLESPSHRRVNDRRSERGDHRGDKSDRARKSLGFGTAYETSRQSRKDVECDSNDRHDRRGKQERIRERGGRDRLGERDKGSSHAQDRERRRQTRSEFPSSEEGERAFRESPAARAGRKRHKDHKRTAERQRSTSRSSFTSEPRSDSIGSKIYMAARTSRQKGRGDRNAASTMDLHFSESYNPAADGHADLEDDTDILDGDDWTELLRDRRAWQTHRRERLAAAGFKDDEIPRPEHRSEEADGSQFRWAKQGERREWDRGKQVDEGTGDIVVKPEWGRLNRI